MTTQNTFVPFPVQLATITASKADGSSYIPGRHYIWAGIVTGKVELIDTVTNAVTYEDNATFDRKFTRL